MSRREPGFICVTCDFISKTNCNLTKHFLTKKHLLKVKGDIIEKDLLCKTQCKVCNKKYTSVSGLWYHNQKCKVVETIIPTIVESSLEDKIEELMKQQKILTDLIKNQQPSIINNNSNNNFNISIFLNDKCGNACSLKDFIDKIDFKGEHFEKFILDYVNGNVEVIQKNFDKIPQFERPFYSFKDEDKHQSIVHIQHDKKWVLEPEIAWERQIENDQDNTCEEDALLKPNSMYSLVRMFDMKKMQYFNDNCMDSHLRYRQRKLEKDTCDTNLQKQLIKKLVEMATINPLEIGC
jgi:hypothetical protein